MSAADFILDIEQRIKGDAATELERTQAAFDAAAGAMKRFERDQMSADKALAALAPRLDEVKGKMASAMEAGDGKAFWKAAGEMEKLEARQRSLAEKSAAAAAGFAEQARAAESAGGALAEFAAQQRAAAQAAGAAADEAKALAEQQKRLEGEAKALAQQQADLERHTLAASRASAEQARTMQQQQAKAIAEVDQRMQRMNDTAKVAAVAMLAVAAVAAKAAWEAAKWVGAIVFAKKAAELEKLSGRLKKNFGDIFGGLNLEPIMAGLGRLVDFFDTSTASGKALKALFEGIFGPLAANAEGVFQKVERLMLGMVIGALKIGIAVKQAAAAFDFELGAFENWPDVGKVGELVAYAVVGAFAAMAAVVAAAAYPYYSVINAIAQLQAAWSAGKVAMDEFVTQVGIVWSRLDFGQIASDLIDGFVKGIKDGASRAVGAMSELATSVSGAFTLPMKINSPSKLFEQYGKWTTEGFTDGVDDGAPDVRSSMAALVDPPELRNAPTRAGGGATITIGTINVNGVENADDIPGRLREALLEFFEGTAAQVGAPA